jgi:hypothetical protein
VDGGTGDALDAGLNIAGDALGAAGSALDAAGSVLEGAGGCLDGCGGCSLALLVTLFAAANTAMALFR